MNLLIRLVDGRTIPYRLLLQQNGKLVSVREELPDHLPSFCPERHINYDGTFCLYYPAVTQLDVTDSTSATIWLETLYTYLKLQERAKVKRKWPTDAWAHGEAANHQRRALSAALAMNDSIYAAIQKNQFALIRRESRGRPILEILINGDHLYSVWENQKRVINQTKQCFCNTRSLRRPKKIRRCNDHSKQASELALAIRDWEDAEKDYWNSMHGSTCCGSCDDCPMLLP